MTSRGKVILITGASSGIGEGTASELASRGYQLSLTGRNLERLNGVKDKCIQEGLKEDQILVVQGDMCSDEDVERIVKQTVDFFGSIYGLVNNAGIPCPGNMQTLKMSTFDKVMNLNLRSVIYITKLLIPYLIETKGCIVNVSSVASLVSTDYNPIYSMAKAGLDKFTSNLAADLAKHQIRVNAVNPGVIITPLYDTLGYTLEQVENASRIGHAMCRHGEMAEVTKAIAFLISDDSSFITGVRLPIDGGRHIMVKSEIL
ncbi:3-oxoacyl-[acyl-carrier-protein] reductase FabG-like [Antedon mediterranea]|uniref:3-oxoacyl-[acyl-carrier-protein] reductase FabG-like n=1 Tax=Antedon mediterranea TaxID=105859 RepID=UPI003AF7547E